MTYVHKNNDIYRFVDAKPEFLNDLPAATYGLRVDVTGEVYLEKIEDFDMPSKVYGDIGTRAERIKNTYKDRKNITGVLLCGEKGSGKTLLGKKVALDLLAEGQPIIVVNMAITGDSFGSFLQRIGKPVTLFFDEFEKVYPPKHQEGLLTILDGVYPVKALAILTSNSDSNMADALKNRPGRIFYNISYDGLDYKFAEEYTRDKLKDLTKVEEVMRLVTIATINFDQLQAIIEEMNRYGETALEAVQLLNIDTTPAPGGATVISILDPEGHYINPKSLKTDKVYFDYGNVNLTWRVPNPENLTVEQFMGLNGTNRDYWSWFRSQWGDLYSLKNVEVMPFLPSFLQFNISEPDDEEATEEGCVVSGAPNNSLLVTTPTGFKVNLKRNKVFYRKAF